MVDAELCKERHERIEARLEDVEKTSKEFLGLAVDIRELVVEIKYMREDMTNHSNRIDKLESRDSSKWDKFKWIVLGGGVTAFFGMLGAVAVKYIV